MNIEHISFKPSPYCFDVDKIIEKYDANPLTSVQLMKANIYESLVPFNLWYHDPDYHVEVEYVNNQYLRVRMYRSSCLTPLASNCDKSNDGMNGIRNLIAGMTYYQPIYPEKFFTMWEILKHGINTDINQQDPRRVIVVSRETGLGAMEALMMYHERYHKGYQTNQYHILEIEDRFQHPDYLGQTYTCQYVDDNVFTETSRYHSVYIDAIQLFDGPVTWSTQEQDLHTTLHYFISSLNVVDYNSNVIVRMSMASRSGWMLLLKIAENCFDQCRLYRCKTTHPVNGELYLLAKYRRVTENPMSHYEYWNVYRMLYRQNSHQLVHISVNKDQKSSLNRSLQKYIKEWGKNIDVLLGERPTSTNNSVETWCNINDIPLNGYSQNGTTKHNPEITCYEVERHNGQLHIFNDSDDNAVIGNKYYQAITEHRGHLNFCKRVMDTKPSMIFTYNGKKKRHVQKRTLVTWEQISGLTNPLQLLPRVIRDDYQINIVSNAWVKLYEILNAFTDIIMLLSSNNTLRTFHLCEAPGAFISATQHFMKIRNVNVDYYAQTLNPRYDNCALDDVFGLIRNNPKRWIFGTRDNDSGDITHSVIIRGYADNPVLQNVDFMTADAGTRCHPREINEQEAQLCKVLMGQLVCIFACLRKGGSAVVKTFLPLAEPLTVSLLACAANVFNKIFITKPTTSHSTNSEVYLVLQEYQGIDSQVLEQLLEYLDDDTITSKSFIIKAKNPFLKSLASVVDKMINSQVNSLYQTYSDYYQFITDKITGIPMHNTITKSWLMNNPIVL